MLYLPPRGVKTYTCFQGGNNNGNYFTSLNYIHNDGIVRGDKDVYKRLSAQINADYNIKKWLQVGTKFNRKMVYQVCSSYDPIRFIDELGANN